MENLTNCNSDSSEVDTENSQSSAFTQEPQNITSATSSLFFSNDVSMSSQTKKRKLSEIDNNNENFSVTKKFKNISNIEQVGDIFISLIEGKYKLEKTNTDTDLLSFTLDIPGSGKMTLKIDNLPQFYQKIAKFIMDNNFSIGELTDYFIKRNYDWNKQGNFKETLVHYLIMLPDSVNAFNHLELTNAEYLLSQNYDQQGYSPIEALTELYVNDLGNRELYKNLKASFDVIYDFDNCDEKVSTENSKTKTNEDSAFTIMLFNRSNAFETNDETIIRNFLEVLAIMCQHSDEITPNEFIVQDGLKDYESSEVYMSWFKQYLNHYAEKDENSYSDEKAAEPTENKCIL